MSILEPVKKYIRSILPPYSRRDTLPVTATLLLMAAGPLTVFSGINNYTPQTVPDREEVEAIENVEFVTNELLFKVTRTARGKVNIGKTNDIGIPSLNAIVRGLGGKVVGVERIARPGGESATDSEVFSWYTLTLEGTHESAVGMLNRATNRLASDNPSAEVLGQIIARFTEDSAIDAAEPNFLVKTSIVPNDPFYSSSGTWGQSYQDMWGLHKVKAEGAWDVTSGSTNVVVAIIDTGVDRNHEDLVANMWVNEQETPNNGIDDDGNGYVDDNFGWDWVNNDNDPMDDHGHGTHTSGTIAAVGNNGFGVVGLNWTGRIMALKFLNAGGSGSISDAISAFQYAADMGADISSNSWGCSCNSQAMDDAIAYEHDRGMVVVTAAGNNGADALDFAPTSADRAISVAASDTDDRKAGFSNFGQKIDVAAPGVDVLSLKAVVSPMCNNAGTIIGNYCRVSGTSMAAPHVAGLAALLLAKDSTLINEEIRQLIRTGAADLGILGKDKDFGYGRIDAGNSLSILQKPLSPIITSPQSRTIVSATSLQILGSASGPDFAAYRLEVGAGRDPAGWLTVTSSSTQVIDGVLATVDTTQLNEGQNIFRLSATSTSGNVYQFQIHDVTVDNIDGEITSPIDLVSLGTIDVIGTAQTKNGVGFAGYSLEWGEGTSPTSYTSTGITLVSDGGQPVSNGKLGSWDTSGLVGFQSYTLRLTVRADNGSSMEASIVLRADSDLVPGWPKVIESGKYMPHLSPVMADLDGDGIKEVIFLASVGKIHAYRKDGSDFPGFPVTIDSGFSFNFPMTAADLDGDGAAEIIAMATDRQTVNSVKKIYVVKGDGTHYPGWPQTCKCHPEVNTLPAVGDLNSDGVKELIFVDDKSVHALQLDGSELAGFPKQISGTGYPLFLRLDLRGNIAVVDLDGDNVQEIALGSGNPSMALLDNTGNPLPGWPYVAPAVNGKNVAFESGPAFGDVDGDGIMEIFAIGNVGRCGDCSAIIYGWKKDGSVLPGWPKIEGKIKELFNIYSRVLANPAMADIDNDGKDEIVVSYDTLMAFDLEGKKFTAPGNSDVSPFISDVDGDGKLEFSHIRPNPLGSEVAVVDDNGSSFSWIRTISRDGTLIDLVVNSPGVIADLDGNGKMELAVAEVPVDLNWIPSREIRDEIVIYLWEIPAISGPATKEWSMFGHDPALTGNLATVVSPGLPPPPPDTESPTAPANLLAVNVTFNQVDLSWEPSTDNVGVVGYRVLRDGNQVAEVAATSYGDATISSGVTYGYHVVAYDAVGNISANSNTVSVTIPDELVQEGTVFGVVTDASTGSAISGAGITINDPNLKGKAGKIATASTNSSGEYSVTLLAGTYDVFVSQKGFDKQVVKGVLVESSQGVNINFLLDEGGKKGGGVPGGGKGGKK